ncbi:MAG TPA: DUF2269 family protein [Candidatus Methylomirabilis sp.]|nr:DUF2269 family protein [Candidatus Methylomirabilis sp.]
MIYLTFKFLHIVGFILLGSGLVGVFVAEWRSRQTRDIRLIAEAHRYMTIFYDGVVLPGAILVGLSGLLLMFYLQFGFFQIPWLTGMWLLFAFEFMEGNTITRIHFRKMRRVSQAALNEGRVTSELQEKMDDKVGTFTHYLDLPLFFVIVSLGGLRPATWTHFTLGTLLALVTGLALSSFLPRMYRKQEG